MTWELVDFAESAQEAAKAVARWREYAPNYAVRAWETARKGWAIEIRKVRYA